jgi:hypothetical protein
MGPAPDDSAVTHLEKVLSAMEFSDTLHAVGALLRQAKLVINENIRRDLS